MRKYLIPAAAVLAMSGFAAAPASAQYYGGQGYGYDRGYGYDHRYDGRRHFAHGKIRQMQRRVAEMRRDIRYFDRVDAISRKEARRLDRKARRLQHRLHRMGYNGLTRHEFRAARQGIRNLRFAIQRDLRDGRRGNRYASYGYGYGQRDRYYRDDDRWERDRRWDSHRYDRRRDRRWDRDDDD